MTPAARERIKQTIADLQALLDADCDCPEADGTTVREIWDRYLVTLPTEEHWVKSIVSMMRRMLAKIGDLRVAALKISDVQDYRDDPEIRANYGTASLNLQIRRLRACLNWALDSGRIGANPIQRMKLFKKKAKRETEISHEGEAAALELMNATMQVFFMVAIDSAMRRDEVRLLEWEFVDWAANKIRIPAGRTKSRRERIGRLTDRAAEALRSLPRSPTCSWVFANPATGEPYARATINLWWRTAADGAGLKPAPGDRSVRLHDSRASTASRMVRAGASMPAIQQILGHADLATTAAYVRVQGRDVDEAHALLEAHLILARAQRKGPQRARGISPTESRDVRAKSSAANG